MNIVAIFLLALLALYGGVRMTADFKLHHEKVNMKNRLPHIDQCKCGGDGVNVLTNGTKIVITCQNCGRVVHGYVPEAIRRWNAGESGGSKK